MQNFSPFGTIPVCFGHAVDPFCVPERDVVVRQYENSPTSMMPSATTPERLSVDDPRWLKVVQYVDGVASLYANTGVVAEAICLQSKSTFVDMPYGQELYTAVCDPRLGGKRPRDTFGLHFGAGGSLTAVSDNVSMYTVRCRSADKTLRAYRFERVKRKIGNEKGGSVRSVKDIERIDNFSILHVVNDTGGKHANKRNHVVDVEDLIEYIGIDCNR
jgi:hypothetical protein